MCMIYYKIANGIFEIVLYNLKILENNMNIIQYY